MKKSQYLTQKGQSAALKCGVAIAIFIAAVAWGVASTLYQSGLGIAGCWIAAIVSIISAIHFGRESTDLFDRAFDAEMREITGRRRL